MTLESMMIFLHLLPQPGEYLFARVHAQHVKQAHRYAMTDSRPWSEFESFKSFLKPQCRKYCHWTGITMYCSFPEDLYPTCLETRKNF